MMQSFVNEIYESPKVEVIEVEVEMGFATSGNVEGYEYGGSLNGN